MDVVLIFIGIIIGGVLLYFKHSSDKLVLAKGEEPLVKTGPEPTPVVEEPKLAEPVAAPVQEVKPVEELPVVMKPKKDKPVKAKPVAPVLTKTVKAPTAKKTVKKSK